MDVVDSHLHLWDPSVLNYEWLQGELIRPFGPDELATEIPQDESARFGFVFVQADCLAEQSVAEVDWVTSLIDRVPVLAVVAHSPLESQATTLQHLEEYATRPLVTGVRRLLHAEPEGFCLRPEFLLSARELERRGYSFDACVRWWQLTDVISLADAVPELRIVLDHLGKPPVCAHSNDAAKFIGWAQSLRELARRPNVVCKLSGLPAEFQGNWTPYLDVALEAFGPRRLLFGSDWPVSGGFSRWFEVVMNWLDDRVGGEGSMAVLADNAKRVYRLPARS